MMGHWGLIYHLSSYQLHNLFPHYILDRLSCFTLSRFYINIVAILYLWLFHLLFATCALDVEINLPQENFTFELKGELDINFTVLKIYNEEPKIESCRLNWKV